jgi:hypothetical protein
LFSLAEIQRGNPLPLFLSPEGRRTIKTRNLFSMEYLIKYPLTVYKGIDNTEHIYVVREAIPTNQDAEIIDNLP